MNMNFVVERCMCGSTADVIYDMHGNAFVECENPHCRKSSGLYERGDIAIEAWNKCRKARKETEEKRGGTGSDA